MIKRFSPQSGVTLIELTLATAIMSFMLLILTTMFISLVHQDRAAVSVRDSTQNTRYALDDISREARRANTVQVIPAAGPANFNQVCLYQDSAVVQYYVIPATSGGRQILYRLTTPGAPAGAVCLRTVNPAGTPLTSPDLDVADFRVSAPMPASGIPIVTARIGLTASLSDVLQRADGSYGCTNSASPYCSVTSIEASASLRGAQNNLNK